MTWGAIGGAAVSVVGGAVMNKMSNKGGSSSPVQTADPFASQRAQYQPMLQSLMNDPNSASDPAALDRMRALASGQTGAAQMLQPGYQFNPNDPSYQFRLDQGSQNINRNAARGGMLESGNVLAALQDYGQQSASQEFSNEFQRQAGLDASQFGQDNSLNGIANTLYNNRYSQLATLSGATSGSPVGAAQLQSTQQAGSSAGLQGLIGKAGSTLWNYATGGGSGGGSDPSVAPFTPTTDFASQLMPTLAGSYSGTGSAGFGTPSIW